MEPKRMVSLDILRGIAILMVLVVHAPWPPWMLDTFAGRIIRAGAYGVDLFFVLSGYLISRLLFAELKRSGSIKLTTFWLRRGFKIWPSYYVAYLLAVLVTGLTTNASWSKLLAWPNFVFLQNYVDIQFRWFASWSLAVEEHFYTTLPLLLLLIGIFKSRLRSLAPMLLTVCCCVPILRFFTEDTSLIWIQTHLRMDALCWGVLLGYCEHLKITWPFQFVRQHSRGTALLMLITAAVILIFPYTAKVGHTIGFTLIALCSAIWTGHAVGVPDWISSKNKSMQHLLTWISRIGVYSYTIYLVQQLTKALIETSKHTTLTGGLMNSHAPQIAAFVGGSILLGWSLSLVVERPFLVLRERLVPR